MEGNLISVLGLCVFLVGARLKKLRRAFKATSIKEVFPIDCMRGLPAICFTSLGVSRAQRTNIVTLIASNV